MIETKNEVKTAIDEANAAAKRATKLQENIAAIAMNFAHSRAYDHCVENEIGGNGWIGFCHDIMSQAEAFTTAEIASTAEEFDWYEAVDDYSEKITAYIMEYDEFPCCELAAWAQAAIAAHEHKDDDHDFSPTDICRKCGVAAGSHDCDDTCP